MLNAQKKLVLTFICAAIFLPYYHLVRDIFVSMENFL